MTAITILKQLDLIPPLHPPPPQPTLPCWGGWFTDSFIAFMSVSFPCYCCHCCCSPDKLGLGRIPLLFVQIYSFAGTMVPASYQSVQAVSRINGCVTGLCMLPIQSFLRLNSGCSLCSLTWRLVPISVSVTSFFNRVVILFDCVPIVPVLPGVQLQEPVAQKFSLDRATLRSIPADPPALTGCRTILHRS